MTERQPVERCRHNTPIGEGQGCLWCWLGDKAHGV